MNDTNPDEIDEIASAVLDGEATPEELARLESSPELQARVATLRAARDAVASSAASTSGLDDVARDRLVAGALAAVEPAGSATVVPFTQRRRGRRIAWVAGAAAAAAVIVGVTIATVSGSGSTSHTASPPQPATTTIAAGSSSTDQQATASGGVAPPDQAASPAAPAEVSPPTTLASLGPPSTPVAGGALPPLASGAVPPPDLGPIANPNELASAIDAAPPPEPTTCGGIGYRLTWVGTPAVAVVDATAHQATVHATASCQVLSVVALP
jgi:hypothetical protein